MKFLLSLLIISATTFVSASELFLQMEIPSTYTVLVGDQTISNSNGKFRFFDLPAGAHTYQIYHYNELVVSREVYIPNNTRTVIFITSMGSPITQGSYTLVEKDWFNTYLLNGAGSTTGNVALNRNFEDFIKTMQDTHTDARKLQMANDYIADSYLTANHVEIILRTFDFDSNRVSFATNAYKRITDPQNYFIWKEAFDFKTSFQKVESAIKSKR